MLQVQGLSVILQSYIFLRNDILLKDLLLRRNIHAERLQKRKMSRLVRRPPSVWFQRGKTDQWWSNNISGSLPDEGVEKKL